MGECHQMASLGSLQATEKRKIFRLLVASVGGDAKFHYHSMKLPQNLLNKKNCVASLLAVFVVYFGTISFSSFREKSLEVGAWR